MVSPASAAAANRVVIAGALLVEAAVGVHEARPLDGRAPGRETELAGSRSLLVACSGRCPHKAHAVVEVLDALIGPGVPDVLDLSVALQAPSVCGPDMAAQKKSCGSLRCSSVSLSWLCASRRASV